MLYVGGWVYNIQMLTVDMWVGRKYMNAYDATGGVVGWVGL